VRAIEVVTGSEDEAERPSRHHRLEGTIPDRRPRSTGGCGRPSERLVEDLGGDDAGRQPPGGRAARSWRFSSAGWEATGRTAAESRSAVSSKRARLVGTTGAALQRDERGQRRAPGAGGRGVLPALWREQRADRERDAEDEQGGVATGERAIRRQHATWKGRFGTSADRRGCGRCRGRRR
jgi:hypothetical protein